VRTGCRITGGLIADHGLFRGDRSRGYDRRNENEETHAADFPQKKVSETACARDDLPVELDGTVMECPNDRRRVIA